MKRFIFLLIQFLILAGTSDANASASVQTIKPNWSKSSLHGEVTAECPAAHPIHNDGTVVIPNYIAPESSGAITKTEAAGIVLDVDLEWNREIEMPYKMVLVKETGMITAYLSDMPSDSRGFYIELTPEQSGSYQAVMVFQRSESLMFTGRGEVVIRPDIDLSASTSIGFNAAEATKLVTFKAFLPDGTECMPSVFEMGEDDYYLKEEGTVYAANIDSFLTYKDKLAFDICGGILCDGIMTFPEDWGISLQDMGYAVRDFFINEIDGDWQAGQVRTMFGFGKEDTYCTGACRPLSEIQSAIPIINPIDEYWQWKPSFNLANLSGDFSYLTGSNLHFNGIDTFGLSLYMTDSQFWFSIPTSLYTSESHSYTAHATLCDQNKNTLINSGSLSLMDRGEILLNEVAPIRGLCNTSDPYEISHGLDLPEYFESPWNSNSVFGQTAPRIASAFIFGDNSDFTGIETKLKIEALGNLNEYLPDIARDLSINISCNGEPFFTEQDPSDYADAYKTAGSPKGKMSMKITSPSYERYGIASESTLEANWDNSTANVDKFPPTLTYLQTRNADTGIATDTFDNTDGAYLQIACGDWTPMVTRDLLQLDGFLFNYYWADFNPVEVEVQYSPAGMEEWQGLECSEVTDAFWPRGFGSVFDVSLAGVSTPSPSKWYDLKTIITDQSGNTQVQTIGLAFKLEHPAAGLRELKTYGKLFYDGQSLRNADGGTVEIYNLQGECIGAQNLTSGIYIVKGNGETFKIKL